MLNAEIWSGTGNSFIICSLIGAEVASVEAMRAKYPKLVIDLCQQHKVDGFLTLSKLSPSEFEWDFYNNDGSRAEMCGNAARCVASFVSANGLAESVFHLKTLSGSIKCIPQSEGFSKVEMSVLNEELVNHKEQVNNSLVVGDLIDSGVPHFVIDVDQNNFNLEDTESLTLICKQLRETDRLPPRGANITFLKYIKNNEIDSISFERGVENFTLACGTGAVAAAYSAHKKIKTNNIVVNVPGGVLKIDFSGKLPVLYGPTKKHKDIEIG